MMHVRPHFRGYFHLQQPREVSLLLVLAEGRRQTMVALQNQAVMQTPIRYPAH